MMAIRHCDLSGAKKKDFAYQNPIFFESDEDDASVNEHNAANLSSIPETRCPGAQTCTGHTHIRLSEIKDNLNVANGSTESFQISPDSRGSHLSIISTISSDSEKSTEQPGYPTGQPHQGVQLGLQPNQRVSHEGNHDKREHYDPKPTRGLEREPQIISREQHEHERDQPNRHHHINRNDAGPSQRGPGNGNIRSDRRPEHQPGRSNGPIQQGVRQRNANQGIEQDQEPKNKCSERSTEEAGCPTGQPLQGIPWDLSVIQERPHQDKSHRRELEDTRRKKNRFQRNQQHEDTIPKRSFRSQENPHRREQAKVSPKGRLQLPNHPHRREHVESGPTSGQEPGEQIFTGMNQNRSRDQHEDERDQPNQQQNINRNDFCPSQQGPGNGDIQSDTRPQHQPGRSNGPRHQRVRQRNSNQDNEQHQEPENKCNLTWKIKGLCCFFNLLLVAGGIATAITLITFSKFYRHKVMAEVRVNDTYDSQMQNTSSPAAQQWGYSFCETLKKTVGVKVAVENCTIESLSSGSVVVKFNFTLLSGSELTKDQMLTLMTKSGAMSAHQDMLIYENLYVFKDSFKVFEVDSKAVKKDDVMSSTTKDPDSPLKEIFDCSVEGQKFRPFRDTYPSNCGTFQVCVNGHTSWLLCQSGLEYVHSTGGNVIPCQEPSNLTYCGHKRLENQNHVTSESTTLLEAGTSNSPLASTVTTEQISQPTTNEQTSQPTTEKNQCSGIDKRVWQNSSSLYTCPKESYARLPRYETYPGNCSAFLWCFNGNEVPYGCSAGTHFTLNPEVCTWDYSPDTFCNQIHRVKICMQQGLNYTDFAAPTTHNPASFPSTNVDQYTCDNITLQYLPLKHTYPSHCGRFQQCVNGTGYVHHCPDHAHFTLRDDICISPTSPDTYCAQKETASNG